jgi:hypothetical protein
VWATVELRNGATVVATLRVFVLVQ